MTLLINVEETRRVLTMEDCLTDLEQSYKDLASKEALMIPSGGRWDVWTPLGLDKYYVFGSMQGVSRTLGVFALRLKTDIWTFPWEHGMQTRDKYAVRPGKYCGLVLLFSIWNGEFLAILNDAHIQHMRVGATAGVAAKYMAKHDASHVGMLGSGGMARTYLEAFARVRKLTKCTVYSPTKAHREAYASEMRDQIGINVIPVDSPEKATKGTDIVASCTDAAHPVIEAAYLERGMHVSPVGAQELASEAIAKIDLFVRHTQGDAEGHFVGSEDEYAGVPPGLMRANYNSFARTGVPTLADLISGKTQGRTSERQVTCYYNSQGSGLQFAVVAHRAYEQAKAAGLGREIPTDWFLQDERN